MPLVNHYLMVELDDSEIRDHGPVRTRTCLRMNVADVKAWADKLTAQHIEVDYQEHSWGTVAKFFDPDGIFVRLRIRKNLKSR